jgi:hypothetical protein
MSGDVAQSVKVADFTEGGMDDLLIYNEPGKTTLYKAEASFDEKVRYTGDEFTILEIEKGITLKTEWDFSNDGLTDKVRGDQLFIAKSDGSFYSVPQKLPSGNIKFSAVMGWSIT